MYLSGVNRKQLGNIDGFDLWSALVLNKVSSRSEVVLNIDDLSDYASFRRGNFKYIIGRTETGSDWLGASGDPSEGISPQYDPYKILYSKTGVAISGIITAKQAMELKERRKRSIKIYDTALETKFEEKILSVENISELRRKAQIKCNVQEKDRVSIIIKYRLFFIKIYLTSYLFFLINKKNIYIVHNKFFQQSCLIKF